MYRPLALVSLWFALLAPSAGAATVGVYDDPEATAVALAGPDAVVLRHPSYTRARLVVAPRGGGKPQTILEVKSMRRLFEDDPARRLAASAQRVALMSEIIDRNGGTIVWRIYSGPPRRPVRVVQTCRRASSGRRCWWTWTVTVC